MSTTSEADWGTVIYARLLPGNHSDSAVKDSKMEYCKYISLWLALDDL
jgi:hypothetical protein